MQHHKQRGTDQPAPRHSVARSPQTDPVRVLAGDDGATGVTVASTADVLALQRTAGNQATTEAVQREVPTNTTVAATSANIATLDGYLGKWNTPEEKVIDLLGTMSSAEKNIVIAGYRDKLSSALNFKEMKRAVVALNAPLATKLDWMQKASIFGSGNINYSEIADLVQAAPKAERDALKTEQWKSYFLSVCINKTIVAAVKDLGFDLPTQLSWIRGETSWLTAPDLDAIKPLLTAATPADIAIVGGDFWIPFWVNVCNNTTMVDLVLTLFPGNLPRQLKFMTAEAGAKADVERVKELLGKASSDQRQAVYDNAESVALIRGFPSADQAAIVQALGGPPLKQMTLLGPTFPIAELTWPTPTAEWLDAIIAVRPSPLDALKVAGANLAWAPLLGPKLAGLFRGKTDTAFGNDMVALVWAAYDAGAKNAADTFVFFRVLFGKDVTASGNVIFNTPTNATGRPTRQRYPAVAPDDKTATELMKMVRTIPRNQVGISPIAFANQAFDEANDPVLGWKATGAATFDTSFFWQNKIVIKVDAAGHMDAGAIDVFKGEGTAYGAVGTAGPGGALGASNALTYFQNHVRHEIGHAVGQKAVGTMTQSGDDFFRAYGGFATSSQAAFVGAMWTAVAKPATGWPKLNFGGGARRVTDTEVRDWLVGLLATQSEVAGPIKNGTKDLRAKIGVIAGSIWGTQRLTNFLTKVPGRTPTAIQDSAYMFPGFTPSEPVYTYLTRGSGFTQYSKAAHDALHATTGWYSLSSHKEMFAEVYTRKYSGGGLPPAVNGKDPAVFFTELERQSDPMFGAPAGTTATTPAPAASP